MTVFFKKGTGMACLGLDHAKSLLMWKNLVQTLNLQEMSALLTHLERGCVHLSKPFAGTSPPGRAHGAKTCLSATQREKHLPQNSAALGKHAFYTLTLPARKKNNK